MHAKGRLNRIGYSVLNALFDILLNYLNDNFCKLIDVFSHFSIYDTFP